MDYLFVAFGGAIGSLSRFLIGRKISERARTAFPIATFIVNITGAFLLGIISSIGLSENIYTLLGSGYLGAYTTFSTFMYESFNLFKDNDNLNALVYIIGSIILGMIGYILGFGLMSII